MRAVTRGKGERGIALMITALSTLVIVPVVGLAIDAGFLYVVKAKLVAATDAAAIAAARSLSKGLTLAEQESSAIARAQAFFNANFPDGFFNTRNKSVTVQVAETAYRTRTVYVQGSVDAGLYFMRLFGYDHTTVRSAGKASRRDVNVILVLDRSGSMDASNSCEPMKEAAQLFVNQFANGRDRLGLITFGMSYLTAFPPSQDFKPGLANTIAQIDCSGGTGTAQALWKGYELLQAIDEPGTLNLIVFFTDGLPNGITAEFPVKKLSDVRYGHGWYPYSSTRYLYNMEPSPCRDANGERYDRRPWDRYRRYYAPNWNPYWNPQPKTGVLAAQGNATYSLGYTYGITYMQAASVTNHREVPISDSYGCDFASNGWKVRRDIAYIPDYDLYGNSTRGYLPVYTFPAGHPYAGKIRPDRPISIGRASKNAADNAARRMRQDPRLSVVIYTIGLGDPTGTVTPPDDDFMMRVANDPNSPAYNPNEPEGLYVFAPDRGQLAQAFYRVASEILRLSQ